MPPDDTAPAAPQWIAFGDTVPALLAGAKTVIRLRRWTYADASHYHPGDLVDAYDKPPSRGGKRVATIRIVRVYREPLFLMPPADYAASGLAWLAAHPQHLPAHGPYSNPARVSRERFDADRRLSTVFWVVRFVLEEVLP